MTYRSGERSKLQLRVSRDALDTVGWATEVLTILEYAYNIALVIDYIDEGYGTRLESLSAIIESAPVVGLPTANYALRLGLPPDIQLQLDELRSENPIIVKVDGIAKIIEVIVANFTPRGRRRQDAEEERKKAQEKRTRETFDLETKRKRVKLWKEGMKGWHNFKKLSKDYLGDEQSERLDRLLMEQFLAQINMLELNNIQIIEPSPSGGEAEDC
ncbi:hypothetical protein AB0L13_38755 [Saccharopolyspora shandongensis]|uniref:hypothetical protein n=1 Tax=Saccharopolyspora shandongensis TaxID=418495 RepID=UPI00342FF2B5